MDAVTRDIEQAVSSRMGGFGLTGTVVVLPTSIELRGVGRPAAIETPNLVVEWVTLSPEQRMLYATDLARRLGEAVRAARSAGGRRAQGAAVPWIFLTIGGVVLLAALGVFVSILRTTADAPAPGAEASAQAAAIAAADRDRAARVTRSCEASRKKAYSGAALAPHEADGWEVELWLAKGGDDKLDAAPAIRALVTGDKLAPSADADLARVEAGTVVIEDAATAKVPLGAGWSAVRVRFTGGYAERFLDGSGRARFDALADRTARAVFAGFGALYGRCAHLETHELGAWYYGLDARGAAASLLYTMGLYAELPAIPRSIAGDSKGALGALAYAGDGLNAAKLADLLASSGGTVSSAGGGVTLAFPLGGPMRATAASRDLARALKVDVYSPAP